MTLLWDATPGHRLSVMAMSEAIALAVVSELHRGARRAGSIATFVGAGGGSAASVGAVAATGTAGLSAAGITSGLATVGAAVGGGMVAGVAVTAAAPAVVAAALGYASYGAWKRLRRKSARGAGADSRS